MYDDIERMFNQEIRDKKRTATGIHHRASRRGYTGTIRTQVDYLKGKEKKLYMGNGEIKVSNLYDTLENLPSFEELNNLDFNTAKNIAYLAKKNFSNKQLIDYWKINNYTLYIKVFKKFGVYEGNYATKSKSKAKEVEQLEIKEVKKQVIQSDPNPIIPMPVAAAPISKVENDFTGFEVKFGGKYTGKQITDRLMNYISILAESSEYKVIFKIEETKNKMDYLEVAADVTEQNILEPSTNQAYFIIIKGRCIYEVNY